MKVTSNENATKLFPNTFDIIVYIILFILSSVVSTAATIGIISLLGESVGNPTGLSTLLVYILSFLLAATTMLLYKNYRLKKQDKKTQLLKEIGFAKFSPFTLLSGIIFMFAASIVVDPIIALFPDSNDQISQIISSMGSYALWTTVFAAPVLEEVILRGIVLNDFRKKYGTFVGVLASAIIFAIIHFNLSQFFSALLMGIVLGYIYVLSKSIWCVIVLHAINNGLSLTLTNLFPEMYSLQQLIKSDLTYGLLYIVSAAITILMLYFFITYCRKSDGKLIKISDRDTKTVD